MYLCFFAVQCLMVCDVYLLCELYLLSLKIFIFVSIFKNSLKKSEQNLQWLDHLWTNYHCGKEGGLLRLVYMNKVLYLELVIPLKLHSCYTVGEEGNGCWRITTKVTTKEYTKKEENTRSRKDLVQPRRVMKECPGWQLYQRPAEQSVQTGAGRQRASRREVSGEKGDSNHFVLCLRICKNLRRR